jgi:hypothetical protein
MRAQPSSSRAVKITRKRVAVMVGLRAVNTILVIDPSPAKSTKESPVSTLFYACFKALLNI